ncbi:MAG: hydroxysqualene dehydroxylase HpnE [Ignavibacteria bacterium]|nr:hydroxysqualene dehydroxylase HpnE [Ignavibacteria bacterium]
MNEKKKCIVIGGGFAGLSTAAFLCSSGYTVQLLEASPKLGGRAYSFLDNKTNTVIDNGQHILMGCYKETLNFLKLIGADKNLLYQDKLEVNFVKENFQLMPLKSAPLFYPLNLLIGMLKFKAISFKNRIKLLKIFAKLPFYSMNKLNRMSVYDWLVKERQDEQVIEAFWKILAIGALNTHIKNASAKMFVDILKEIFLNGNFAATIILPKFELSETYCEPAKLFIEKNGGSINLSSQVTELINDGGKIEKVVTTEKVYDDFDFVISAIPHFALEKIITNESLIKNPGFDYSSIINIHIWLNDNPLTKNFYGLIGSPIHWIFNKGSHLNLVISDADEFIKKDDEELFEMVCIQLKNYVNLDKAMITGYKVIKEKRATFIPSNDIINKRPLQLTGIKNLILAGDWVDTGLPATIESAVKSGREASELVSVNY